MTHDPPGHPTPSHPPLGHEPLAVSTRALVLFIIVFTVALIGVLAVVAGQYAMLSAKYEGRGPQPSPLTAGRSLPPAPRVQTNEPLQLAELRRYEEARLNAYSWVDRPAGVARVPIERAMQLLIARQTSPAANPIQHGGTGGTP